MVGEEEHQLDEDDEEEEGHQLEEEEEHQLDEEEHQSEVVGLEAEQLIWAVEEVSDELNLKPG